ncbi:hypothetical protein OsJ_08310 [Oryza sativa Japonica Group]|nr:hypothetical protein OsJ_08310 [Oryza sativa Japonica Group]
MALVDREGDGDLGEECEGGEERPRRRQQRGAPVEEAAPQRAEDGVEEARRDHPRCRPDLTDAVPSSSTSAAGDDDDDPFLLAGFISMLLDFS